MIRILLFIYFSYSMRRKMEKWCGLIFPPFLRRAVFGLFLLSCFVFSIFFFYCSRAEEEKD